MLRTKRPERAGGCRRRETVALVAWSVPGLLAGAILLSAVPERPLEVLVAVVVLLAVGLRLSGAPRRRPWSHPRAATTGLTSGVLSTSTGIGGPPLVFHLLGRGLPRTAMRDTLAVVWLAGGVLSAIALIATGTFALPTATPLLVAATLVGYSAGRPALGRPLRRPMRTPRARRARSNGTHRPHHRRHIGSLAIPKTRYPPPPLTSKSSTLRLRTCSSSVGAADPSPVALLLSSKGRAAARVLMRG